MATQPSEFIGIAAELIGDEFAPFASDAVINQTTGFDYATQTNTAQTQTQPMIRLEYSTKQVDGQLIKTGDVMLMGEYQLFDWEPSPDNTEVVYRSVTYELIMVPSIDPASATIILHCRPK